MDEDDKNALALYTFTFFGFGTVSGAFVLGFIQDKFGHKASLLMILLAIILTYSLLLIQNERRQFDWSANLSMFVFGMIDNCLHTFFAVVLGFEFESKIIPFGARHFIGNLSTAIILMILTLSPVETKSQYRYFFIASMIFGLLSTGLIFFIKFKKTNL